MTQTMDSLTTIVLCLDATESRQRWFNVWSYEVRSPSAHKLLLTCVSGAGPLDTPAECTETDAAVLVPPHELAPADRTRKVSSQRAVAECHSMSSTSADV